MNRDRRVSRFICARPRRREFPAAGTRAGEYSSPAPHSGRRIAEVGLFSRRFEHRDDRPRVGFFRGGRGGNRFRSARRATDLKGATEIMNLAFLGLRALIAVFALLMLCFEF